MKTLEEVELRNNLHIVFDKDGVAVNLTFKRVIRSTLGNLYLDEIAIEESLRHFVNFLSRRIYKSANKRYGKKVSFLYCVERGAEGLLHAHGFIPFPDRKGITSSEFRRAISEEWKKVKWSNRNFKSVFTYNRQGWIDYCLKRRTKTDGVLNGVGWY